MIIFSPSSSLKRLHRRNICILFALICAFCPAHFALASLDRNWLISRRRLSIPPPGHRPSGRHDEEATATCCINTNSKRISFFRGGMQQPSPIPHGVRRSVPTSETSGKDGESSGSLNDQKQSPPSSKPHVYEEEDVEANSPFPEKPGSQSINKKLRNALGFFQEKLPGLRIRVEPSTKIKLRKTFYPLGATVLRIGADFDAQLGIWQFRSSWEDRIIGGALNIVGREIQIQKNWRFNLDQEKFGGREDLMTSVRFRAAVDLATRKAYAKVGFQPERIRPFNVYDGFRVARRLPLDGKRDRIKLELKARLALPEPEVGFSTETSKILVGLGDVEMTLEELNLLVDY